jgi:hypothetical protein
MPLTYLNLDDRTRHFMLEEIDMDANAGKIYLSSYLSPTGQADWPALLRRAAQSETDGWFGAQLRLSSRLNTMGQRRKPKGGGYTMVRVPITAHETLSEGEFNRFYIRGLCRRAIADNIPDVIVYRAKAVDNPRPESQHKIGAHEDPAILLRDLREHVGVETSSGFPGPNSGLSVKLP